jgi:hypothetical protein
LELGELFLEGIEPRGQWRRGGNDGRHLYLSEIVGS